MTTLIGIWFLIVVSSVLAVLCVISFLFIIKEMIVEIGHHYSFYKKFKDDSDFKLNRFIWRSTVISSEQFLVLMVIIVVGSALVNFVLDLWHIVLPT
jgi:uncharacterized membrane protein YwzB